MKLMKNNYFTLALLATFSFFAGLSTIQAQDKPFLKFGGSDSTAKEGPSVKKASFWSRAVNTPWIINVTPDDVVDNDLGKLKGLFKIKDDRNYYPIRVTAEKLIKKGISLQLVFASETMNTHHFTCVDVNAKYNLKEIIGDTKWFDPYAVLGGGYTYRRFPHGQHTSQNEGPYDQSINLNVGGGMNIWLFPNAGINAQTLAKFNLFESKFKGSNYWQWSLGVVFRIGGAATTTQIAETKATTLPSNYKRTKEAEDAANYLRDILNKK